MNGLWLKTVFTKQSFFINNNKFVYYKEGLK